MIIVIGTLEFDPEQRDAFIASRHDGMRTSRGETGCLEFTISADPLVASRGAARGTLDGPGCTRCPRRRGAQRTGTASGRASPS